MADKALDNVKVIEFAQGIAGPYAAKILADMGAEVIKIELPTIGDKARHTAPFVGNDKNIEKSCIFLYANSNKKSITLDLDTDEGVEIFKKLVADADILIREGQPEYFNEKGLSYEELSKDNPGLILCSNTPFGESGPYKDYAATPFILAHMSGNTVLYPHGTGDQDRAPTSLGGNFEEYDTGSVVAIGILAALHYKNLTGEGQYIENSSLEARFQDLTTETVLYPVFGQSFNRAAETQRLQASLNFACKDGYLCPFFTQTHEYVNFARVVGKEDWIEEPWFSNITERRARCEDIMEVMREWGLKHTKAEAVKILQSNRVPIGPVETPGDVVESEQYNYRGFFTEIEHPVCGKMKFPGRPFILTETPHTFENAAPLLGANNEEILGGILGYDKEQIEKLKADKVI